MLNKIIKRIFCNHTSQACITSFDTFYLNDIITDTSNTYKVRITLWGCERCGKIIKKKIIEEPSTINWSNTIVKNKTQLKESMNVF